MVSRYATFNDEFVNLRDFVDRFFAEVGAPARSGSTGQQSANARMPLPLDVYATRDDVVLIAAVPGVRPEEIDITINQNTVTLVGRIANVAGSEEARDSTWYLHELPSGAFQRSVTLPIDVDASKADATFEHGILRLTLPKAEAAKPRQIKVRSGSEPAIMPGEIADR